MELPQYVAPTSRLRSWCCTCWIIDGRRWSRIYIRWCWGWRHGCCTRHIFNSRLSCHFSLWTDLSGCRLRRDWLACWLCNCLCQAICCCLCNWTCYCGHLFCWRGHLCCCCGNLRRWRRVRLLCCFCTRSFTCCCTNNLCGTVTSCKSISADAHVSSTTDTLSRAVVDVTAVKFAA